MNRSKHIQIAARIISFVIRNTVSRIMIWQVAIFIFAKYRQRRKN
jgi:hypothetical protein